MVLSSFSCTHQDKESTTLLRDNRPFYGSRWQILPQQKVSSLRVPLPLQDGCNSWLSYFLIRGIFPRLWTNCHNIEHIENLYIENLWEQDSKCSCSFFHFCSNLCYITLRLCNFYNSIYSNKSLLNVKIGQYWHKIQASLALFEENMLFLQWLSNLCVNLNLLNIDKQTANAELKAEKSKQLSR